MQVCCCVVVSGQQLAGTIPERIQQRSQGISELPN